MVNLKKSNLNSKEDEYNDNERNRVKVHVFDVVDYLVLVHFRISLYN